MRWFFGKLRSLDSLLLLLLLVNQVRLINSGCLLRLFFFLLNAGDLFQRVFLVQTAGVHGQLSQELPRGHPFRNCILIIVVLHLRPKGTTLCEMSIQLTAYEQTHEVVVVIEAKHATISLVDCVFLIASFDDFFCLLELSLVVRVKALNK